jgi:endoglucanase
VQSDRRGPQSRRRGVGRGVRTHVWSWAPLSLLIAFFIPGLTVTGSDGERFIYKNLNSQSVLFFDRPSAYWICDVDQGLAGLNRLFNDVEEKPGGIFLLVQYIIPHRDRGGYSHGGLESEAGYRNAVRQIARAIGDREVILILEPDELGLGAGQLALIDYAVGLYRKNCSRTTLFIDSGNPAWLTVSEVQRRLDRAGIERADGIALNVSSFHKTVTCLEYGKKIIRPWKGKRIVIDTSRNGGANPPYPDIFDPEAIVTGQPPTFQTGDDDGWAFLWIKPPGEADGRRFPPGVFNKDLVTRNPDFYPVSPNMNER